jgi:hypothetical protein
MFVSLKLARDGYNCVARRDDEYQCENATRDTIEQGISGHNVLLLFTLIDEPHIARVYVIGYTHIS